MKKVLILALAALLMFSVLVIAEEAPTPTTVPVIDGYELTMVVPDGYRSDTYEIELGVLIALTPDDPTRANVVMTVVHSEEMDGVTLSGELTKEQEAQVLSTLDGDIASAEISYAETAHGTHLILIHENSEADEYLIIMTVWNGYQIETDIFPGEGEKHLTDDQIEMAVQFVSDFFIFEKAAQ